MFLFIYFQFNPYSSLLLPFVLQGLIFSVLLFWRGWRESRLADKLLAILILLLSLRVAAWMLGFAGWYDSHDTYTTFMFYFPWSNTLVYGPLVWLYFRSLTNVEFKLKGKQLWHFIPFAIYLFIQLLIFTSDIVIDHWFKGAPLPYFHGTRGYFAEFGLGIWDTVIFILSNLSLLGYFSYSIWKYQAYKEYIQQYFSETSAISFQWLRNFLLAFLFGLFVWIGYTLFEAITQTSLSYVEIWYSHLAWGMIIYYLSIGAYGSHPGLTLPLKFNPHTSFEKEVVQSKDEPENPWKTKLENHIRENQPFLNPELTLNELAQQLQTSPAIISKTINTCFGQNFNDFINTHRVEAVKEKILDKKNRHLSFLGIALECGFNSKATFNRAFKKHVKQSPSEFIKSNKIQA